MSIIEKNTRISDIPCLTVYKNSMEEAGKRGTILFYHGLYSNKENNRKELASLANYGFLAIGIDNAGHGERAYPDLEEKMNENKSRFDEIFIEMVSDTAKETKIIIDELLKKNIAVEGKIGVCGISMGGYISYAAVIMEKRLNAVVPILGSPYWNGNENSPDNFPEKFENIALLAQNGGKDTSVPAVHSREFIEKLKPYFSNNPEKLCYIEYPDSPHFMLENDWYILWSRTLKWFERFF